jgi:phosphatidylglycerophosphate synthase
MGPADQLTVARMAAAPVIVALFAIDFDGHEYWATALFAVAMATDWVDGWLARRSGSSSAMGSLLDPVADKILVLSVLIVLLGEGVFAGWAVAAIVVREFLVSGLRLAALERGDGDAVDRRHSRRVRGRRCDRRVDRVVGAARGARRDLGVRARLCAARPTASPQPRLGRRVLSATRR